MFFMGHTCHTDQDLLPVLAYAVWPVDCIDVSKDEPFVAMVMITSVNSHVLFVPY